MEIPDEVSLLPIDVGFDLRLHEDVVVDLAPHVQKGRVKVRYMHRHREMVFTGHLDDAYRELRRSGYQTVSA